MNLRISYRHGNAIGAVALGCALFAVASSARAVGTPSEETGTAPKNQQLDDIQARSVPPSKRDQVRELFLSTITRARSAEDLYHAFSVGVYLRNGYYDPPMDHVGLPAPSREALRDYFQRYLFYRFKPSSFWPHYPDHWIDGMRSVLTNAIREGYEVSNLHHAVCFIPLFFTEEQASQLGDCATLNKCLDYRSHADWKSENSDVYNRGLNYWLDACWQYASEQRRVEMINALFVERVRVLRKGKNLNDYVQLHLWFEKNPVTLKSYLTTEGPCARKWIVWVAAQGDSAIDYSEPLIVDTMIAGLGNSDCGVDLTEIFTRILSKHFAEMEQRLRAAFDSSTAPRQMNALRALLEKAGNSADPDSAGK